MLLERRFSAQADFPPFLAAFDSQWKQFGSGSAHAKTLLLEASSLKERDPAWHYMMQRVALAEGWNKARARELFARAIAFEPGYYHYYRQYANYVLPQWNGESGRIAKLC